MLNYWLWLFLLIAPAIVFSVKPEAPLWQRVGRLLLAVGLAYIFINLALHLSHDRRWEEYEACRKQSAHRIDSLEMFEECKHHAPNSGASTVFYLFLGWIPAAGYVGLYELLWRIRYRAMIRDMENFKGRWVSNVIIGFFIPCFLYVVLLVAVYFLVEYPRSLSG